MQHLSSDDSEPLEGVHVRGDPHRKYQVGECARRRRRPQGQGGYEEPRVDCLSGQRVGEICRNAGPVDLDRLNRAALYMV